MNPPPRAGLPARPGSPPGGSKAGRLPTWAWLMLLAVVPLLGGAARLWQLALGGPPTPDDLRFAVAPLPVTLHIAAAAVYCLAGASQFNPGLRARRPALHRALGRLAVACGALMAATGLWMTLASPIPQGLQGDLLRAVRVAVATGMGACLVLGVRAIRAGQPGPHRAWMARAYALAQGAGTQALLLLPLTLAVGEVTGQARDLAMTAAWLLNLAVVEHGLARAAPPPRRP